MEKAVISAGSGMPRRRGRRTKLERKLKELSDEALDCLGAIMNDSSAKPADRIAAVKLTLELAERKLGKAEDETGGVLRVVFDGAPTEWSE